MSFTILGKIVLDMSKSILTTRNCNSTWIVFGKHPIWVLEKHKVDITSVDRKAV